jgi:hypothetical protein
MKYIRTEKGIYEVVGADSCSYLNAPPEMYYITSYNKNILKSKVIAQADTIEELCDEFVLVNENVFTKPQMLEDDYNRIDLNYYKNEDIYGAIWTDKGLIYVAKMNEKGELCLISHD